jgi:hypothetical protein
MNCTDSFYFDWVMKALSPVMMDELFPERLDEDSDDEFDYNFIDGGDMAGEYSSIVIPQQSTTEYAAAIQLSTTPQTINHPYRFHLEAYKHLINITESNPAASDFLGSLLNEKFQKMVEFTTARELVETPVAESPMTPAFAHHPTAVITYSHCPTSRKRKCKRLKRAGEYSKKKKYTPRANKKTRQHCFNLNSITGSYCFCYKINWVTLL